jgi:hypothetical protein
MMVSGMAKHGGEGSVKGASEAERFCADRSLRGHERKLCGHFGQEHRAERDAEHTNGGWLMRSA